MKSKPKKVYIIEWAGGYVTKLTNEVTGHSAEIHDAKQYDTYEQALNAIRGHLLPDLLEHPHGEAHILSIEENELGCNKFHIMKKVCSILLDFKMKKVKP